MLKKNLVLALSVIGILISAYLLYAKLTDNPLVCAANLGCNVVQRSKYSTLLGMPLGFWGMGYYFVLFAAFYVATTTKNRIFRNIFIAWGLLFSVYLTVLEAFVINAFCLWCLTSFVNIILITIINFAIKDAGRSNKGAATNLD